MSTARFQFAKDFAAQMLSIFNDHTRWQHKVDTISESEELALHKVGNVSSRVRDDEELIQKIIIEIQASDHPQSVKDAAEILLTLRRKIECQRDKAQTLTDLVTAIRDPRLTLKYADLIYRLHPEYHFMCDLYNKPDRKFTFFFPHHHTNEWKAAVLTMRGDGLIKLREELVKIPGFADRLAYLEEARSMPLFADHMETSVFTGRFGRTFYVEEIDNYIDKVRADQRAATSGQPRK